jgi:hypothetical protein
MKKTVLANILLALFLLTAGPALAAVNDDLDVTMQLIGIDDRSPGTITNQIELPEIRQTQIRNRNQTLGMAGEPNNDMTRQSRTEEMQQLRDSSLTRIRTEEMQQLRDSSRSQMQDQVQEQMQEERQQIMMDESRSRQTNGGNR